MWHLNNLEELILKNTKKLKSLAVFGLEKLVEINVLGSQIQEIDGLDGLKNLKKVILEDAKLINSLPTSVDSLQVDLSDVENFSMLLNKKLPKLTGLTLHSLGNQKPTFEMKGHPSLNRITLNAPMQDVSYGDMPQLEEVYLLKPVQNILLQNLPKMKDVNFQEKDIEKLSLRNLGVRKLFLNNTRKLQELELDRLPNLYTINLSGSSVASIRGLTPENLPDLQHVFFYGTAQLEEISVGRLNSVQNINFSNSGIRKIEGLNNLPYLTALDLGWTKNLEEVTLQNLDRLEELHFKGSHVKKLYLENLNSINILDLSNMPRLEEIVFKGSFKGLKTLWVAGSKNLKSIEGLENLEGLVAMDARLSGLPKQKITGLRSGIRLDADEGA